MATTTTIKSVPPKLATRRASRRFDDLFFFGMAFLILATVFVGFANSYFFAGVFRAPLPNLLIHIHAAAFTSWILLLITQASLVSAGRVDIHRRLGVAGFCLAFVMVILGTLAATNMLARGGPAGADAKTFYAVAIADILLFGTLVLFAFRMRRDPSTHKRLILIATIGMMDAALDRWPVPLLLHHTARAFLFSYIFLMLIAMYDLWSMRKVHRATVLAGAFVIFMHQISFPIGGTAAWHTFAGRVQEIPFMRF